jgi:putative endonuclease
MIYVYVLKSDKDGRYYVGMTQNLVRRLKEHNSGRTKSTKGYRPWILIHHEAYPNREAARKREKYLKSGYGKQWLKNKYNLVP